MTISVGHSAQPERADGDMQSGCAGRSRWRLITVLSVRSMVAIWALLSIAWGGSVGYDIYHRAKVQADMSRAVEQDLDQSFVAVSCKGPSCSGGTAEAANSPTESWSDIMSTYMQFGSMEIGEYALGPPLGVLAVGLAAVVALRRRRRSN